MPNTSIADPVVDSSNETVATSTARASKKAWRGWVAPYETPDAKRATWQVVNTSVPFLALWALMYFSLGVSYWITLALAVPTSGLLVRLFIFSHDCGHGSFFASKRANEIVGFITSTLTFTPYHYWRHNHAVHHANAQNLDRRGPGEIWTLTLREYEAASRWQKLRYRMYRNPFVMFLIGPVWNFMIMQRWASPSDGKRWQLSVQKSNLGLLAMIAIGSLLLGVREYWMIQLPVMIFAGIGGIWLFYVQHQFEDGYYARRGSWEFVTAALQGSSYYALPKLLHWFSGNIGFHHIHHLSPRIPNYFLEKCHRENPPLRGKALTVRTSLRSLAVRVWDEEKRKLVPLGPMFL